MCVCPSFNCEYEIILAYFKIYDTTGMGDEWWAVSTGWCAIVMGNLESCEGCDEFAGGAWRWLGGHGECGTFALHEYCTLFMAVDQCCLL